MFLSVDKVIALRTSDTQALLRLGKARLKSSISQELNKIKLQILHTACWVQLHYLHEV